jgi:hypothetical protein
MGSYLELIKYFVEGKHERVRAQNPEVGSERDAHRPHKKAFRDHWHAIKPFLNRGHLKEMECEEKRIKYNKVRRGGEDRKKERKKEGRERKERRTRVLTSVDVLFKVKINENFDSYLASIIVT